MTDEIKTIEGVCPRCEKASKLYLTTRADTVICPLCASFVVDIGPFDPGPFYKEEEINSVIAKYFDECWTEYLPDTHQMELCKKIVKYLDEKRNRKEEA